jgi:quercetin dioxygenase-like cupin family protein
MNTAFERPYRPVDLNTSLTKSFPLISMAEQLMSEDAVAKSGRTALTLARGDNMTVVLTVIKAGTVIHEHQAPGPATIIVLSGSIVFSTSTERTTLEQGSAVSFSADVLHAVEANEDSGFLIVIGGLKDA